MAIIEKQQSDDKSLRIHRFNAGKKLRFSSETMFLDMNLLKNPSELNKDEYSLIIKMETEEEEIEKELIYTYCAIAQGKIEVLKQKIEFADKALLMYEIYGNSSKDSREK